MKPYLITVTVEVAANSEQEAGEKVLASLPNDFNPEIIGLLEMPTGQERKAVPLTDVPKAT